ncbi:unnamed protein product [Strongylus vulgaris]|uniref:Uncharacterized protein n=1 Tax=Strongylus vulgaris TaxID=40348 RepID=A0A3P7LJX1_STRVU|nr:unnamed protein product [Strongylus vulgaris]
MGGGGKPTTKSNVKKYQFRRKLSEFNNTVRLLETKLEEALWNEEYKMAIEIEECLKKFRSREIPLHELLKERHDAVVKRNYVEAQRTMDDALQSRDFEKFLTVEEVSCRNPTVNLLSKKILSALTRELAEGMRQQLVCLTIRRKTFP